MIFPGKKLRGQFKGEVISYTKDGAWLPRVPGARIKHRVKENWLKMYDKAGSVLRVDMVITNPAYFKVRKKVTRKNKRVMEWVSMRKGVAYLFRYREVSQQANYRYLDALSVVEDPSSAIQQLDAITTRKETKSGRGVRALNSLCREDIQLFKAMMAGEYYIRGISNSDIRTCLESSPHSRQLASDSKKQSAKVSRILSRFHAHRIDRQDTSYTEMESYRAWQANHVSIFMS